MTEQEKYLEGHRNCGIKVGDQVRVTRRAESDEGGWGNVWVGQMGRWVGKKVFVVEDFGIMGFGVGINKRSVWNLSYPYFVLEKI